MINLPEICRRVRERNLTYLSAAKLRSLFDALGEVESAKVPGAFVEYGIALGGSAICVASQMGPGRVFCGYDVFAMIPPPGVLDGETSRQRYALIHSGRSQGIGGEVYYGYVPDLLEQVRSSFAGFGIPVDGARIRLVKGRYEETLDADTFPIAFAHIDCDWYDSVRTCLDHLRTNLSPDGRIVLDDYNDWEGCRKATDEFCAANPDFALKRTSPHAVMVRGRPG